MTPNQANKLLCRFGNAHDVNVLMRYKKINIFNVLPIAFKLWRGAPIAKITNHKWFYGLEFYTNRHTLDPRPDSETLVQAVLKNEPDAKNILDLGTGGGCLIISILKNLPNAAGLAIDRSGRALRVARKNRARHGLNRRLQLKRGRFTDKIDGKFDVVISNPPYIPIYDKSVNRAARFDPRIALYAGPDGLDFYRQIARINVAPKIYLEIGAGQHDAVTAIFENQGWQFGGAFNDLAGIIRVLMFYKN